MDTDAMKNEAMWREFWEQSKSRTCAGALGIDLISIDEDSIVLRLPITDAVRQPYGLFHGGVSMVLAETAGSMHSCWGKDLSVVNPVGIEINGSHLNSAKDGHVVATGRVVKRGRTLIVHEVEVRHEETDTLLNVSRITNIYIPTRG